MNMGHPYQQCYKSIIVIKPANTNTIALHCIALLNRSIENIMFRIISWHTNKLRYIGRVGQGITSSGR